MINDEQIESVLLEALETGFGKIRVYTAALECGQTSELSAAWRRGLELAMEHVRTVIDAIDRLSLPSNIQTSGRLVAGFGASLVTAIHMAHDADRIAQSGLPLSVSSWPRRRTT